MPLIIQGAHNQSEPRPIRFGGRFDTIEADGPHRTSSTRTVSGKSNETSYPGKLAAPPHHSLGDGTAAGERAHRGDDLLRRRGKLPPDLRPGSPRGREGNQRSLRTRRTRCGYFLRSRPRVGPVAGGRAI